ncbi:LuxR C-terminal-related transcriptional regulator [Adlercreutzia muris]|uniref:helix-turn-helix transcriptional regulator n=1 Tax=Adlercreutzia muris TaxID=1796610 RepID=UPI0021D5E29C|nr:LuxR family transcriptional regulator [Adlercreutzia muris]MCU7584674.1 LuxR C-terminal-related transcriptional regulator [Adlercreutzia muris]
MGKLLADIRKGREDRALYLAGILPYLFALGCARAWVTLAVAAPALRLAAPFDLHDVFDCAMVLISIAVALAARRLVPLNATGAVRAVSAGAMVAASLALIAAGAAPLPEGAQAALAVLGTALGGLGFGLFLVLWAEVLSCISLIRIFLYTTASQLAGVVFVFFCSGLDGLRVACAMVVLPVAAILCLRMAFRALPVADRPSPVVPKFTYPWKIFALLALFSFAYGLRQHQLAAGAGMHSSLSTAIVMAVLFAGAYFFSSRLNIGALYRSPFVLIVCGFLLVPSEGVFGAAVSSYLISMSYSLVGIIVALLLYDIAKRLGVTVVAFAAVKGAEQIFVVGGKGVSEALGAAGLPAGVQDALIAGLVVAMMVAAMLILLSEKELASRWGVRILDVGGLVEKTPDEERREARVAELAEHARLTPRETEILHLIAQGKNGPAIRSELFIAEGTLKAHTSHIYEKCGVANRRELAALLGSARP